MPRRRYASAQAAQLFCALSQRPDEWRYGYDLLRRTGLASGTLYPLLMRLHEAGYLEARWETASMPSSLPRHAYRLTKSGAAFAHALLVERGSEMKPAYREKLA